MLLLCSKFSLRPVATTALLDGGLAFNVVGEAKSLVVSLVRFSDLLQAFSWHCCTCVRNSTRSSAAFSSATIIRLHFSHIEQDRPSVRLPSTDRSSLILEAQRCCSPLGENKDTLLLAAMVLLHKRQVSAIAALEHVPRKQMTFISRTCLCET